MKKWLAKLILRDVAKGWARENVSKAKAGAGVQFGAESAVVVAAVAYLKAKWGIEIPAEVVAGILAALAGKFLNSIGVRDAMPNGAEVVSGELVEREGA